MGCFFFVCNEWVKYLEIRIISIKVIPWIIGTVGECTCHLRNWSEEWQCFMSAYCQVWDARWCMPRHALSSAQDGFFLRFTAASLMIQTAEVLGSSQVCFTQHTYPKFSPVKKRNQSHPQQPTGWVSPHRTDVQAFFFFFETYLGLSHE